MGGHHAKMPPNELQDLCKRTNFDQEELKQWYDKFRKEYPKGSISKDEFINLYKGYYKSGDAKRFSEHVFRVFDVNNDERIGKYMETIDCFNSFEPNYSLYHIRSYTGKILNT